MTRPTGNVPGSKKCDKKGLLITTTRCCALFGWWGKLGCPEENGRKHVPNRHNHVDITKHKCRDIGLPDWMGVPNRQASQRGWVNGNYPFGYTTSLLEHSLKQCYVISRSGSSRRFTHSVNTQAILRYPYVFWWIYNLQYFCIEIFRIDLKYDFLLIKKVFIK